MNKIERAVRRLDEFQQRHRATAFGVAVVKKYSEDQGGYQAALLTYYGFLALFPLLLVLTTLAQLLLSGDSHARSRLISGATSYFPVLGDQLQRDVHGLGRSGIALVLGLLVLLYGARGVADVFRSCANRLWKVPPRRRSGFLPATARSFGIIAIGGLGFLGAAVIAGYATAFGHFLGIRLIFLAISAFVLFVSFLLVMKLAINRPVGLHQIWAGAATATLGLLLLQWLGGYLVTHELRNLNNLYGTFALVLGLLFWLYLQTQLVVYAIEIDTVRAFKRWPRKLID